MYNTPPLQPTDAEKTSDYDISPIPVLSIIIPAFNHNHLLFNCVSDLFNQSLKKIELIIIDDGSIDRKEYEKFKNIKFVSLSKNMGIYVAYNVGIYLSSGKYICFWDIHDRILKSNVLEVFCSYANQAKADFVISGKYFTPHTYGIDKNSQVPIDTIADEELSEPIVIKQDLRLRTMFLLQNKISFQLHGKIFSREFLIKNNIKFIESKIALPEFLFIFKCICEAQLYLKMPQCFYLVWHAAWNILPKPLTKENLSLCVEGMRYLEDYLNQNDFFSNAKHHKKAIRKFYLDSFALRIPDLYPESISESVKKLTEEHIGKYLDPIIDNIEYTSNLNPSNLIKEKYPMPIAGGIIENDVIYNVNHTNYNKNALLIFITHPFTRIFETEMHQNVWQFKVIPYIISSLGYNVDILDWQKSYDSKEKYKNFHNKYDLFVGNLSKIDESCLNENCIKTIIVAGSSSEYSFFSEQKRLKNCKKRRNVMPEARYSPMGSHLNCEDYDGILIYGNEFNISTYGTVEELPKAYFLGNNGYIFDFEVDFSKKQRDCFLFFASGTSVLKGLDLLLEIFGQKDFPAKLFICSSFKSEPIFCEVYKEELFNRKNIFPVGFIDIKSEVFKDIVDICSYVILPSSLDGAPGSILTAMSAGLIPIVSKDCGFDEEDFITLPDCEIPTLEKVILEYSQKPLEWIEYASYHAKKTIMEKYTRKNFVDSIREAFLDILQK